MIEPQQATLRLRDLVLFTVSAIILLDTLAATAAIGATSIFWWLFLALFFMVPAGRISVELGTAFPSEGGIYVWTRMAFGPKWATTSAWAYWVNVAIWLPAIYVLFAGVFSQIAGLNLGLFGQIGIGIGLAWLTVVINVVGLNIGKWIPNIGAMIKLLIFSVLIFTGLRHGLTQGFANDLSLASIIPNDWSAGLQYVPAIIYGMLGFELVSAAGSSIIKPTTTIPKATLISGTIVLSLYVLATFGILAAIPNEDIDIVEGLIDTLTLLFAGIPGADVWVTVLGVGALFTFFSNGATWALGGNRAICEAAEEGMLPKVFGHKNKKTGSPVGAAVTMGFACTTALLVYGALAASNADLFWNLFAFSGVIFMLPYIGMVLAFYKLRQSMPNHHRPYRAAKTKTGVRMMTVICMTALCFAIFLFVYVPGEGVQVSTLVGAIVVLLVGEILITLSDRKTKSRQKPSN